MANQLYGLGRQAFLHGSISWASDTIKVDLVSTTYSPSINLDQFHSTVTGSGGIVAAGVTLGSKTETLGTAGAANAVWSSVTGSQVAYLIFWKDTGTDSTSPLIGKIDTATGLPVTPNGGDITAAWASGNIFTLFEGLDESDKVAQRTFLEWLKDVMRIPARLGPGGVWIPEPTIVLA